jgi:redox-sensitive bicupin YhaK (pirin superfamily)
MSWQPAEAPDSEAAKNCPPVPIVIVPRSRDLGGFEVRRVLPSAQRRMVGPFVFLDEMGPAEFRPGAGIDVRPHPHIGLATVTYLFEGTIIHRDSLGTLQAIRPGAVNWMTAGRGIVHSERADPELRKRPQRLHGLQIWIALPASHEETEPAFIHYPATILPTFEAGGAKVRIVVGKAFGETSPIKTFSSMFYADVQLRHGASIPLDADHEERAAYLVGGAIEIAGERFEPGRLLVFRPADAITITAAEPARFVLLGGEPMGGPRHIWWNFVSSRRERIEQAKEDWRKNRFPPVPGETDFIPLPERL